MSTTYDDTDHEIARLMPEVLANDDRESTIRAGADYPSTGELLAGLPFRDDSWETCCAMWAFRMVEESNDRHGRAPLPPAVKRALVKLTRGVSYSALIEAHRAAGRHKKEWSNAYIVRLLSIQAHLDVYLWQAGDDAAAARCALAALHRLRQTVGEPLRVGLLTTALNISAGLNDKGVQRLGETMVLMGDLRNRTAFTGKQAWYDRYNETTLAAATDELPEPVVEDEVDLLTAVAEDRDRGAWAYAKPAPQTRVVFGRMDHLPKVSQMARERGDTPRAVVANLEGVPLPMRRLESDILQVAYDLHSGFSWIPEIIDDVVMDLAMAPAWLKFPRIVFAGPPGCGKTSLAIALGKTFGIPTTVFSAGGVGDGQIAGTSRAWSTARLSVPAQAIVQSKIANPLIIIDEVEKAGTGRHNGNLTDALLALTEPTSSRQFFDPYLEAPVDLSAVSYLGTVNDADLLPSPLRDRFRIVHVPPPGVEHVPAIVKRMVEEIRTERGIDPLFMPDLAPDEIEILAEGWKPSSMRGLRGRVELMLKSRERLATRN